MTLMNPRGGLCLFVAPGPPGMLCDFFPILMIIFAFFSLSTALSTSLSEAGFLIDDVIFREIPPSTDFSFSPSFIANTEDKEKGQHPLFTIANSRLLLWLLNSVICPLYSRPMQPSSMELPWETQAPSTFFVATSVTPVSYFLDTNDPHLHSILGSHHLSAHL